MLRLSSQQVKMKHKSSKSEAYSSTNLILPDFPSLSGTVNGASGIAQVWDITSFLVVRKQRLKNQELSLKCLL
jgi:hypothetical protein